MTTLARSPVIAEDVECVVRRHLVAPEVHVAASQLVEPETIIATAATGVSRAARIALAVELGVAPGEVARYLVRALGERVEAGEVVAARRRGLRSLQVSSPIAGRLATLDEQTGTLVVVAEAPRRPVPALVAGEVIRIAEGAVEIRAVGDLVAGTVLLGPESAGPLMVLADRPDRELPIDEFDQRCRGTVVVAGMTVSSAVLRRLLDIGAAGVIVGSLSVSALEPFFRDLAQVRRALTGLRGDWPLPFGILVMEGFGRIALADPFFEALRERTGRWAALLHGESIGLDRPVCFTPSRGLHGRSLQPVPLSVGMPVHLRIPAGPGIAHVRSLPFLARCLEGLAFEAVLVERDGRVETVPVDLVDLLEAP